MTETAPIEEKKENSKEYNFRALEAKYERMLAAEREEKQAIAARLQELQKAPVEDDDDDSDDYVDKRKLNKKLGRFEQKTESQISKAMQEAKAAAKEELRREMWIEQNPDFYDTLQQHAQRFAEKAPQLASAILKMPDTFERQQLVYQNIKHLGLDKPEQKEPSIQEKIDANRRSPYYQPTGISNAPYSNVGDFSIQGQQQAYQKMQELKSKLRL